MKKTVLLIKLCFLFLSVNIYTQNNDEYKIEHYEGVKQKKAKARLKSIEKTENGSLIIVREYFTNTSNQQYFVELYNKKKELVNQTKLKSKYIYESFVVNDSIYLLYPKIEYYSTPPTNEMSSNFRNVKSIKLNAFVSSCNKLDFSTKTLFKLDKDKEIEKQSIWGDMNLNSNLVLTPIKSENNKYLAIVLRKISKEKISSKPKDLEFSPAFSPSKKKTFSEIYKVIMFEKGKASPLYTNDFVLNHNFDWSIDQSYKINEANASLYFFEREHMDKNMTIDVRTKRKFTDNIVRVNSTSIERVNISQINPDNFLNSYHFIFHEEKTFLTGLYGSDAEMKSYSGFFKAELSNDLKTINNSIFPFSEQFIKDREQVLINSKKPITNALQFNSIIPETVFFDEQDNCILNFLEYKTGVNYNSKAPGKKIGVYLTKQEIPTKTTFALSCKINSSNKLEWSRSINLDGKIIRGQVDSFVSNYKNNTNYIIFNQTEEFISNQSENYKNIRTLDDAQLETFIAKTDSNGTIEYEHLGNSLITLTTKYSKEIDSEYYIENQKGKIKNIVKISF